jgi:hypothetical protein
VYELPELKEKTMESHHTKRYYSTLCSDQPSRFCTLRHSYTSDGTYPSCIRAMS